MNRKDKIDTLSQIKTWLVNEGFNVALFTSATYYIPPYLQLRGGYFIPALHLFVENDNELIFSRKRDLAQNKDGWVYYMNLAEPTSDLLGLLKTLFETDTKLVGSLRKKDVYSKEVRTIVERDKDNKTRREIRRKISRWAATKGIK